MVLRYNVATITQKGVLTLKNPPFTRHFTYRNDIIYCGHATIPSPQENIHPHFHVHDVCELILVKTGSVSAMIGDQLYKLGKNSLIIFRANVPHRMRFEGNGDYERYDILFDETVLANRVFDRIPKNLCYIDCNGNGSILSLFEKLDFYCEHFHGDDLALLLKNTIEEIVFQIHLIPPDDFDGELLSIHPTLKEALQYINRHYCEQITIDDMSRHLCVNKSHLHHLFTQFLQITPKKYINIRRLAKAQKLIRMGEKPSSIFPACGFCDYATFFRNYTSYFGYTPSQENEIAANRRLDL